MKFNTLKASFKNGMVSPRLRGREKEGEITSSAEIIENFSIDKIGAAVKRGNIGLPALQPFNNTGLFAANYDSDPILEDHPTAYFAAEIRGKKYVFRFNSFYSFNAISNNNPSTINHYKSKFLTVFDVADEIKSTVLVYAPYYTGTGSSIDLNVFNKSVGGISSGLSEYLNTIKVLPTHMTKVSDATVVFTCANSLYSNQNLSFTVSLITFPTSTGSSSNIEAFVILPYFVNLSGFISNLGKTISSTPKYRCPLHCSNYPFNVVNTNINHTISTSLVAGQGGTAPTASELVTPANEFIYHVDVPQAICLINFVDTDPLALIGKYLILPNASNTQDVVFFITQYVSIPSAGLYRFKAINTIAGTPEPSTHRWKLSTFGGETHPKIVNYSFNRLIYANAGANQATWWASAIHPDNPLNRQAFMQFSLYQDVSSDVSKLLYNGVSPTILQDNWQKYGVVDPYRYSFSATVPNLEPISFIENRRRIHFGTFSGECQLSINDGNFTKASYDQIKVRSNSATLNATTTGDGKFFYISNNGKDIRFISTEDKDYESIDGLLTTALEGYNLFFTKIIWVESLNSVVARSDYFDYEEFKLKHRYFLITIHEDTQIKAITEIKFEIEVIDMTSISGVLWFVFRHKGYQHFAAYESWDNFYGDMSLVSTGSVGEILPFFQGDTINIFFKGVEYTYDVSLNPDYVPLDFPIDLNEIDNLNPAFLYGKKTICKIKTMPVNEGGGNNSAVGDIQRVDRVVVQVDNSGPFKIGNENGTIYEVEGMSLDEYKTKYVKFDMPQSADIENHIYIESDKPTPLNISGLSYRGVSYAGE